MEPVPLSLYIHFPWCIKKCPYCDFNSHILPDTLSKNQYRKKYVDTLKTDFRAELAPLIDPGKIISIFIGGGTPSLLSGKSIKSLLDFIFDNIESGDEIEITLEANPESMESDYFENCLEAGVNRLSLGIQSFDNKSLSAIGRIHDADAADKAIKNAQQAGFENINLDILFGLPGQTVEMAADDCMRALDYSPAHLSFYQLTIEPGTLFYRRPPEMPREDVVLESQNEITALSAREGYIRYEVSSYTKPGRQSVHNLNYWEFGDYLGIGAGAHSKLSDKNGVTRSRKRENPIDYMSCVNSDKQYKFQTKVKREEILFECMLNALRLKEGISIEKLRSRTGLPLENIRQSLQKPVDRGWVNISDRRVRCTEYGYLFIDEILTDLSA